MLTFIRRTAAVAALFLSFGVAASAETRLQGAGSTFVNPIMQRWVAEYQKLQPNVKIDYQSIGSGGGVKGFLDSTLDFACSDAPLNKKELATAGGAEGVVEFPIVSGGVVPAYNLPGVSKELRFSGPVIADIYQGKITRWNDPKLAQLNPGVNLPATVITPVWRTDGSGTTYIFSSYLTTQSEEFKGSIGAGKQVKWPVGQGGKGNEGVTAVVQQTAGSLGYIEQAYADQNKVTYGSVMNKAGKFVRSSPAAVSKAGEDAAQHLQGTVLATDLWNQPGDEAYPISGFVYVFVYKDMKNIKSQEKAQALVTFLHWAATDGQKLAMELDYAPLSPAVQEKAQAAMAVLTFGGAAVKPVASR